MLLPSSFQVTFVIETNTMTPHLYESIKPFKLQNASNQLLTYICTLKNIALLLNSRVITLSFSR